MPGRWREVREVFLKCHQTLQQGLVFMACLVVLLFRLLPDQRLTTGIIFRESMLRHNSAYVESALRG